MVIKKKRKKITHKLKFIDSFRFMPCKLLDLVDNLSGIYNVECKLCMKEKNVRSEYEFIGFESNRLNYKCKKCGEKPTKLKNEAIKNFPIMHQFCNGDPNKIFFAAKKNF